LTVCAGSCGPGNLHLINGLFDCHRNHVPVLAIAAQIPSSEIGLNYFQETHPQELFKECSHFIELVTNPEQMPQVLHRAMRSAILNRGVAVVVIPGDVPLEARRLLKLWPVLHAPRTLPAEQDLLRLTEMLDGSRKVTLLCGSGCAGAHDQVVALADALGAPVHALRGKEHVEWDNPFDVGTTGPIGFSSGYHAMLDCDTLIMLGTDFPYRQFYPTDAKIIQGRSQPPGTGPARHTGPGYRRRCQRNHRRAAATPDTRTDRSFLDTSLKHYEKPAKAWMTWRKLSKANRPIHPQYVARLPVSWPMTMRSSRRRGLADRVGRSLPEDERPAPPDRFVQPRLHGQRNALAIGAQAAFPDRQVIRCVRRRWFHHVDGGFHFVGAVELASQSHRVR
jgi:pyruvate dehydrogenase (quinone)